MFELELKLKRVMEVDLGREKQGEHSHLGKLYEQGYIIVVTEKHSVGSTGVLKSQKPDGSFDQSLRNKMG